MTTHTTTPPRATIQTQAHRINPIWPALIIVILFVVWFMSGESDVPSTPTPIARSQIQQVRPIIDRFPAVIYGTTPATITADYEFNIESDGPINVEYPGEKPVLYTPGKGFAQLPQPRSSGPKKFTDPKDPENGHIAFRLYPIH